MPAYLYILNVNPLSEIKKQHAVLTPPIPGECFYVSFDCNDMMFVTSDISDLIPTTKSVTLAHYSTYVDPIGNTSGYTIDGNVFVKYIGMAISGM